jgi:hypothetical protein
MKTLFKTLLMCGLIASALFYLSGCNDDDEPKPQLTGNSKTYPLASVSDPGINGTVTFAQRDDDKVLVTIQLTGTEAGNTHPAHIHANTAAETGSIILDLTAVNGADGKSETVVNALNDGTAVTYEDLLALDAYVNVHASETDLATLIAQGDIGVNELTDVSKVYTLTPVAAPGVSGTLTIAKRQKGTSLVTVALTGAPAGTYSSHFHSSSVAQGGPITIDLNAVDGTTGKAVTNVETLNNGNAITYDELLNYNGHFNVHGLGSYIVQADIGGNELTGDTKVYVPTPVANPAIGGTLTIAKRKRGTSLVTVALTGTPAGTYNSHFHSGTMAVGGPITINLKPVDGTTGRAVTGVDTLNNGTAITYDELLNYNGHFNVHGLGSYVVQADIGGNELTGDNKVYTPSPVADPAIGGTLTIAKRKRGTSLVTVALTGTPAGTYNSHFHSGTVATGGPITINLTAVNGTTGKAITSVEALNNGTPITYDELLNYDGHFNVHGLGSYVVQTDIGQNELTGDHQHYALSEVAASGVSGEATFEKRKNGKALITLALTGTVAGASHPAHIHANNAATGGSIVLDLKNVSGTTGLSATSVSALKDATPITYDQLIAYNGHINVHASEADLATLIAQGNIGSNVPQ